MSDFLVPMGPAAPSSVIKDIDGGGHVGGEWPRDDKFERGVAARYAKRWTPEDLEHLEAQNLRHKAWLASPDGQAWKQANP